ncbi:MAG: hypothetical protein Q7J22_01610 [Candidatus Wolfebacteria bacterium]|nr:hypothetical protein [Candidatus Wolfebacteria bacterium]
MLIKGGFVYDGVEEDPQRKDILIRGNQIVRIGNFPKNSAEHVVDASGAFVCPGFIDVSSDIDRYLGVFSHELQCCFLRRGITTVIGGNFGLSLAPLAPAFLDELYRPADSSLGNAHWHSVKEYFEALRRQKLLLNFGTMVGHFNLRHLFSSSRGSAALLKSAEKFLREGAFGISFDFDDVLHARVSFREARMFGKTVAKAGGVLSVRLSGDEDFSRAVRKLIELSEESGVRIVVQHTRPSPTFLEEWEDLEKFLESQGSRANVRVDFFPSEYVEMPVYRFLPSSYYSLGLRGMAEKIFLQDFEEEILDYVRSLSLERVLVGYAPEHLSFLQGKSLKELAETFGMPEERAMLQLMRVSKLRAVCLSWQAHERDFRPLFGSSFSFLSSCGIIPLERALSTEVGFCVRRLKKLAGLAGSSFGKVIAKVTSEPARVFRVPKRGMLRESYAADIVIIRDGEVRQVFLGGNLQYDEGKFAGEGGGKILTP